MTSSCILPFVQKSAPNTRFHVGRTHVSGLAYFLSIAQSHHSAPESHPSPVDPLSVFRCPHRLRPSFAQSCESVPKHLTWKSLQFYSSSRCLYSFSARSQWNEIKSKDVYGCERTDKSARPLMYTPLHVCLRELVTGLKYSWRSNREERLSKFRYTRS